MTDEFKRLVEVADETAELLIDINKQTGMNYTEIVKRAVTTYKVAIEKPTTTQEDNAYVERVQMLEEMMREITKLNSVAVINQGIATATVSVFSINQAIADVFTKYANQKGIKQ